MKINWGTGIVIAMVLFIGFILYFVIKLNVEEQYDLDLVTEDYYEKELRYQEEIDALTNTAQLSEPVIGKKTDEGWMLTFPEELNPEDIDGKVFLYRPSDKNLDFDFPITLSESNLLIPDNRLLDGRWNIYVNWDYRGKTYLFKQEIWY